MEWRFYVDVEKDVNKYKFEIMNIKFETEDRGEFLRKLLHAIESTIETLDSLNKTLKEDNNA